MTMVDGNRLAAVDQKKYISCGICRVACVVEAIGMHVVRGHLCTWSFEITRTELGHPCCPACAEARVELISGREYVVETMEVT